MVNVDIKRSTFFFLMQRLALKSCDLLQEVIDTFQMTFDLPLPTTTAATGEKMLLWMQNNK